MTSAILCNGRQPDCRLHRGGAHAAWPRQGEDIVCAAVTSAVRLTECAVNDVLGLEAPVKVNQQDASVTLKLPRDLAGEADQVCQTLAGRPDGLPASSCRRNIPNTLTVMEV